jgi:autotransporter translocation and assembly factor TamB
MEQGTLSLLGEIGMGRNSTLTVLTKKFQVDMDSRLTFAGAPMDTLLGLEALYPSNYGDISVLVTGQLDRPSIEFVSDELEDQADIMSVLITGKPLSEVTSAEGSGATAAIVQALAGFTTGAFGKYVPVDSLNVELGDDISSGSVEAGKAITPYIFFLARYRWGVDDDENRVEGQLEIRVTRRGYIELRIGDRLEGSVDFLGKVIF